MSSDNGNRRRVSNIKKRAPIVIKRKGALTKRVGGKPSQNIAKVKKIAATGSPLAKKQANLFLNVLNPAAKRRKKK